MLYSFHVVSGFVVLLLQSESLIFFVYCDKDEKKKKEPSSLPTSIAMTVAVSSLIANIESTNNEQVS